MKLELKHIIDAYKYQDDISDNTGLYKITNINNDFVTLYNGKDYYNICIDIFLNDYKILKYPLSDLTKELEINGEKIIPFKWLQDYSYNNIRYHSNGCLNINLQNIQNLEIWRYEKLKEWHFDVDGLNNMEDYKETIRKNVDNIVSKIRISLAVITDHMIENEFTIVGYMLYKPSIGSIFRLHDANSSEFIFSTLNPVIEMVDEFNFKTKNCSYRICMI